MLLGRRASGLIIERKKAEKSVHKRAAKLLADEARRTARLEREKPIIEACASVQIMCPPRKAPTLQQMRLMNKKKSLGIRGSLHRGPMVTALLRSVHESVCRSYL